MRMFVSALIVGSAIICTTVGSQQMTPESAPPVVVKTVPEAGASGVPASTTEIRVTFSKEMQDGSWSWGIAINGNFPETTGKPRYEADRRTCVLPVRLLPGRSYAVWVNSQKLTGFKDVKGQPAVPYLLVFKTEG